MEKLVDRKKLELVYEQGKGAWTYHIVIPDTAAIEGKWGSLKVSGLLDDYVLKEMNLAPRKQEDKMISINKNIREAIGKSGGDEVMVTLFLHVQDKTIENSVIFRCFSDAGVLHEFDTLNTEQQNKIINSVMEKDSEAKQIEQINFQINQFLR